LFEFGFHFESMLPLDVTPLSVLTFACILWILSLCS
jgi:hypothetical protein